MIERVQGMGNDYAVVAALHDVIEDHGDEWLDRLRADGITPPQLKALMAITRQKGESYDDYIRRCSQDEIAAWVKYHDLMSNLQPDRLRQLPPEMAQRLIEKYTGSLRVILCALHPGLRSPRSGKV